MNVDEKFIEMRNWMYKTLSIVIAVFSMISGASGFVVSKYVNANDKAHDEIRAEVADVNKRTYNLAADMREVKVETKYIRQTTERIESKIGIIGINNETRKNK